MKKIMSLLLAFVTLFSAIWIPYSASAEADLDDYDKLRVKWQNLAMGGDYDENDPNIQVLLTSINDVAADLLARINKNPTPNWGSNDYLWSEYMLGSRSDPYSDSNNTQFSLRNIKNMAMAYQTKGCGLYQNETLKNEILRALNYMYVNHFKPGVDNNAYGNWFTWEIGGPIYLCEATLYMYDYLTAQQIQDYAATARKGTKETVDTGANALWRNRVRMLTAILRKNNDDLVRVKNAVPDHMSYTTSGDGYHQDGTFIQHSDKVYNGGYGKEAISDISHFLYLLEGSPWEITDAKKENVFKFVYDHYAPFMYKSVFMDMTRGREISRKDTTDAYAGITISLSVALISEFAPEQDAKNYRGMIKDWMSNDFAMKTLGEGAGVAWYMFPVYNFSKILEILADDTVEPYTYDKSHQFGYGVRTVHAADRFTFGLAMYNNRNIANNETGDSNTRGWYTGTGTYWIYTPDVGQYTLSKPTMNWYRFPGTTVVRNYNASFARNPNRFAGGTTLNEKYSVSGIEIGPGHLQVHARKSWFMFDKEVVALGSDIYSSHANTVETIIDQHRIEGTNDLIINGLKQPTTLGWNASINNASWALIEGNTEGSNIGVYFPTPQTITAIRQAQQGRWTDHGTYNVDTRLYTDNYITLLFDHGVRPADASYSYVLLPGATAEEVEAYAGNSDITIIRQDNSVHAVYKKSLNIVGANFFTDGAQSIDAFGHTDYLTVDKASTVMVSESEEKLTVAVTDTTQSNTGLINVVIDRATEGVLTRDPRVEVVSYSPKVILRINVNNAVGAPIETVLSFLPPEPPDAPSIKDMSLTDDTFTININPAARADGYILQYGTESGVYSNGLTVSLPTVKIVGLLANTTYYFAVKAFNRSGESPLSAEQSYNIGAVRVLVDDFDDYSKIVSYTSGWAFDGTNVNYFEGDTSRLKRDDSIRVNRPETVTYFAPSPISFELITFDYGVTSLDSGRDTLLQIFGSPDNQTWTLIPTTRTGSFLTNWHKMVFRNAGALDPGIRFIKILVDRNERIWAPQLSKFTVSYLNVPDRVLIDTMQDDERVFASAGAFEYRDISTLNLGGETHAIYKNSDEPVSLLYSVTDIQNFRISTILPGGGTPVISYETSTDGVIYSAPVTIPAGAYTVTPLQGGAVLCEGAADLSQTGPTYVRLTFSDKNIYITNLYMEYNHIIAPIVDVRYVDAEAVVVIDYPETPRLKIAPMNGYGEIFYTSGDEDVAEALPDGLIRAKGIGETVVTANILGTQKVSALPVKTFRDEARLKTATASTATSGYSAAYAVNGDLLTRWQSSAGGAQWLKVDLGKRTEFIAVDISWQQYATNYTIQGSDNDSTWDTLYTETAGAPGMKRVFFDSAKTYRYVRVNITAGPGMYSFYELRVLSKTIPLTFVNLALNRPATGSAIHSGDSASVQNPQNAVDGDTSTRWASARSDPQWFTVDLGAVYPIYEIHILWETAAGREYRIQVSDVNDDWNNSTTIVHEINGAAGWKDYVLPEAATGRYVRMYGISRASQYGYSMFEFQVMGVKTEILREITFASLTANGSVFTADTTELTITLDKAVRDLSLSDITVTGATAVALNAGAAPVYRLTISDIDVLEGEIISVAISKAGFRFIPDSRGAPVHKVTAPIEMSFKMEEKNIEYLEAGKVSLEVKINSLTDSIAELNAIIAVYKGGKLIDIAISNQTVTLTALKSSIIETPAITVPEEEDYSAYIVRGFLWDGDMVPLVEPADLTEIVQQ